MTQLDLSDNNLNALKAEGSGAVADALRKMDKMTQLDLSYNGLRAEGAAAVARALGRMDKMTQLNLSNNDLGAEGAGAVAGALERMDRMTHLNLRLGRGWELCVGPAPAPPAALGPPPVSSVACQCVQDPYMSALVHLCAAPHLLAALSLTPSKPPPLPIHPVFCPIILMACCTVWPWMWMLLKGVCLSRAVCA
mmetsp:Transcript_64502/g.172741  ORF Transcript_64502/g.172741 Transcript_64502/m.172741 type:complete len:194 (+) Transcript_64502:3-584(+)